MVSACPPTTSRSRPRPGPSTEPRPGPIPGTRLASHGRGGNDGAVARFHVGDVGGPGTCTGGDHLAVRGGSPPPAEVSRVPMAGRPAPAGPHRVRDVSRRGD